MQVIQTLQITAGILRDAYATMLASCSQYAQATGSCSSLQESPQVKKLVKTRAGEHCFKQTSLHAGAVNFVSLPTVR